VQKCRFEFDPRESLVALKGIKQNRKRLAEIAYHRIIAAIRDGDIADDDQLVQEKLAEELQISRTPVREALLRLEQDGILVASSRGGFSVRRASPNEVRELYDARAAVEAQALRLLTLQNNSEKIAALRKTIVAEENIGSKKVSDYFEANRTIHRKIVELSDNRFLLELFDNLWNRFVSYNLFAAFERLDLSKSFGDHMRLVRAIETGDPKNAMDAMVDHISRGLDLQFAALETSSRVTKRGSTAKTRVRRQAFSSIESARRAQK
jgi:DNA-binding GntR family transcriptional regulator